MITKENLDQLFEWGSSEKILMETIGEDIG